MTKPSPNLRLRRSSRSLAIAFALALCAAGAQATEMVNVSFSEVPLGTLDPAIEGVAFSAGDPTLFEDTISDDGASPGNPYLLAGVDTGSALVPSFNGTAVINATLATLGGSGLTTLISFNAGFFAPLPTGETLSAVARQGGVVRGSTQVTTSDEALHPFTISLDELGFDQILFYTAGDLGAGFRIDDLIVDVSPKGPGTVPVPGTLALLGLGVLALRRSRPRPVSG